MKKRVRRTHELYSHIEYDKSGSIGSDIIYPQKPRTYLMGGGFFETTHCLSELRIPGNKTEYGRTVADGIYCYSKIPPQGLRTGLYDCHRDKL